MARVFAITGASSGLGRALALEYAAPGVALALIGRDEARLEGVAEHARRKGADVRLGQIDVRDRAAMSEFLLAFDAATPIDCLIAGAGVTLVTPAAGAVEDLTKSADLFDGIWTGYAGPLSRRWRLDQRRLPRLRRNHHGQFLRMREAAADGCGRGGATHPPRPRAAKGDHRVPLAALSRRLPAAMAAGPFAPPRHADVSRNRAAPNLEGSLVDPEGAGMPARQGEDAFDRFGVAFEHPAVFDLLDPCGASILERLNNKTAHRQGADLRIAPLFGDAGHRSASLSCAANMYAPKKFREPERKQLAVQAPQRLIGVRDMHSHRHVLAFVAGDANPSRLAGRQHEIGDESRLFGAHWGRPLVVGPGVIVEGQDAPEVAAPAHQRQLVEVEPRLDKLRGYFPDTRG